MASVVSRLAVIAMAALLAPPVASAADAGDIVVVSLKGEVHFTMQGRVRNIRAGGLLEPPVTLRTGRDGAVELRQGETTLSVGPETLLEFPALEKPGAPIDRIVQPLGNVFYNIGKRPGRKLRIETPYLVGVVKGTQFNVAARDGATTISLFEGLLEVRAADNSSVIDLNAGEIASRGHDAPAINILKMSAGKDAPKAPPPAPRPSSGNGAGKDASPVSPRSTPRVPDRDSVLVESIAVPVAVGPAAVSAQPVSLPDTSAAVTVSAPTVETNVSVAADAPLVDVTAGAAASVSTPVADTSVPVPVEAPVTVSVPAVETTPLVEAPPAIDAGVDVGLDSRNTGTSVIVGASAGQVEVQVGSQTAAEAVAGTVNLGLEVSAGAGDPAVDVDLGLDKDVNGNASGNGTDNANGDGNSNVNGNGPATDVGELLDSLVRRPGKK